MRGLCSECKHRLHLQEFVNMLAIVCARSRRAKGSLVPTTILAATVAADDVDEHSGSGRPAYPERGL